MGCGSPQEICGRCTFCQAGFEACFGERLLMEGGPTSLVQSADVRAAMQSRSKVPISHDVVFLKPGFERTSWHQASTPGGRPNGVDKVGTLCCKHSHNPLKACHTKAVVPGFFLFFQTRNKRNTKRINRQNGCHNEHRNIKPFR